ELALEKVVGPGDLDDPGGVARPLAQHFRRAVDVFRADDEERGDLRERERLRRLRGERNPDADEVGDPRISGDRPQSCGRAEREPSRNDRNSSAALRLVERGAEVVGLAAARIESALGESDAAKVEPQDAVAGPRQAAGRPEDDLVAKRASVDRMRMR